MTIVEALRKASTGDTLPLSVALTIAQRFDQEREETRTLLKRCEKNVGMVIGEDINQHLANMNGVRFSARDYHYEKPVGEQ